jgi:beta-phosphoglucomutase-like phosphatase (HAD superfamily)
MSEQPIKGLVFDMDGLLFDSERVVQKSWNEVGRQMGFGERFGDHIYHTIGFNVVRREEYFKEHVSPLSIPNTRIWWNSSSAYSTMRT